MGHEEQDIDEEAQEANKKVENADDEEHQEVPGRVGRAVEVRDDGQDKHDEGQDRGNWVDNEKR